MMVEESDLLMIYLGGRARLANPRLLLPSRATSLHRPKLQGAVSWATPLCCSPNTIFWQGAGPRTAPVTAARGIHTSSLNTISKVEDLWYVSVCIALCT